jgi:hypothetical protein
LKYRLQITAGHKIQNIDIEGSGDGIGIGIKPFPHPEIVLHDIQLSDGVSFDIMKEVNI